MTELTAAGGILIFLAGVVTALTVLARPVWRIIRRTETFLEDWNGTPERDGRDRSPGVMARLQTIEHELQFNSGQSVKDKAHQAVMAIQQVRHSQEVIAQAMRNNGIDVPDLAGGAT